MTNDEAIKTLREDYCGNRIICELYPDQCNREDCEIWLAIKALETQPDGDTISRHAVVNNITEYRNLLCEIFGEENELIRVVDIVKHRLIALPSAQPDICDGCDRYGASCVGEGCGKLEMPEVAKDTNVLNNDTISRQAAVEIILADKIDNESLKIMDALGSGNEAKTLNMTCDRHAELLKSLPSAQPNIAEKLYQYKCYITDEEGLQHEVIHTGDIRRVTGWEI